MTAVDRFPSDRCNPILVREVWQALSGRAFSLLLIAAVLAVLVLTLIVASFGYIEDDLDAALGLQRGRLAFQGAMVCLTPIAMFLIPAGAFNSTRAEVQGGLAEQLAMTRLRPWSILIGKLLAAQVQVLLFVSVFAPFLAFGWLLRGIDVASIAIGLLLVMLLNLVASSFAVAGGALCKSKTLAGLAQAVVSIALVFTTMPAMGMMAELPRQLGRLYGTGDASVYAIVMLISGALIAGLCLTVGMAALGHEYENRSSPFRIWLPAGMALTAALAATQASPRDVAEGLAVAAASWLAFGAPIWVWACCETPRFSPRVRTQVPRRSWLAVLAAPWLPGGARGAAYVLLMAAVTFGIGFGLPLLTGVSLQSDLRRFLVGVLVYVLVYAAFIRLIRRRMAPTPAGSRRALLVTVLVFVVAHALPLLWQTLVLDQSPDRWTPLFFGAPLLTLSSNTGAAELSRLAWIVVPVACAMLAIDFRRAFGETLAASAARRARAS